MIFKDEYDFPLERNGDGMDSSVRAGIIGMCKGHSGCMIDFRAYEKNPRELWGMFVRHPNLYPACNQNNYTRDQAKCFLAGLHRIAKDAKGINYRNMANRFFWKRFQNFFFMQNTERDRIGSTKQWTPHFFYKDSDPTVTTYDMKWDWKQFKFVVPIETPKLNVIETRIVDGPDLLMPNEIGQIIIVGRVWQFYWFMPIAYVFHFIALGLNHFSDAEQNQIFCESYVYGTLNIYRKLQPRWNALLLQYWGTRDEVEYADMMIEFAENPK